MIVAGHADEVAEVEGVERLAGQLDGVVVAGSNAAAARIAVTGTATDALPAGTVMSDTTTAPSPLRRVTTMSVDAARVSCTVSGVGNVGTLPRPTRAYMCWHHFWCN